MQVFLNKLLFFVWCATAICGRVEGPDPQTRSCCHGKQRTSECPRQGHCHRDGLSIFLLWASRFLAKLNSTHQTWSKEHQLKNHLGLYKTAWWAFAFWMQMGPFFPQESPVEPAEKVVFWSPGECGARRMHVHQASIYSHFEVVSIDSHDSRLWVIHLSPSSLQKIPLQVVKKSHTHTHILFFQEISWTALRLSFPQSPNQLVALNGLCLPTTPLGTSPHRGTRRAGCPRTRPVLRCWPHWLGIRFRDPDMTHGDHHDPRNNWVGWKIPYIYCIYPIYTLNWFFGIAQVHQLWD